MSPLLRLRHLLWLCALLPFAAPAENDLLAARMSALAAPVRLDVGVSERAPLSFNLSGGDMFLDWRPYGGSFFTTAGTFSGAGIVNQQSIPTSNVSYKALAPYLGTYLGVGWAGSGSNNKFSWMIDLGVVQQKPSPVSLNILQSYPQKSSAIGPSSTTHLKLSRDGHVGFSFKMRF